MSKNNIENNSDNKNKNLSINPSDVDVDLIYESYKQKLNGILEIKNYKELCKLLNEPVYTNSNSKHKQFINWSKYFYFKKYGQKFINVSILSQEERSAVIQQEIMENSLCYLLYSNLLDYYEKYNRSSFSVTINDLALLLGFFNSEYRYNFGKKHEFAYNLESKLLIDDDPILKGFKNILQNKRDSNLKNKDSKQPSNYVLSETYDFYDHVSSVFKNQIENLLKNLTKTGTILKEERIFGNFICTTFVENKSKNNYGDDISTFESSFTTQERELTYKEKEQYVKIVNSTLKKFECSSVYDVFCKNLQHKYYPELKLALKNNMKLNYSYSVYTLYFSPERVQLDRDNLLLILFDNNANFIKKIKENKKMRLESKNNPYTFTPQIQSFIFDNICNELLNVYDEKEINNDRDWIFKRSIQRTVNIENKNVDNINNN